MSGRSRNQLSGDEIAIAIIQTQRMSSKDRPISLNTLMHLILQRTYHSLYVMVDLLGHRSNIERKIEISRFCCICRMHFIKLLAVIEWYESVVEIYLANGMCNFLCSHEDAIVNTADQLFYLHIELPIFGKRMYELPPSISILNNNARCVFLRKNNLKRLMWENNGASVQSKLPSDLKQVQRKINNRMRCRIAVCQLPQGIKLCMKKTYAICFAPNMFKVKIALPAEKSNWRILSVKLQAKLRGKMTANQALQKRDSLVLRDRLQLLINTSSENCITVVCRELKVFLVMLKLESMMQQLQADLLRRCCLGLLEVSQYVPGTRLTLECWRQLIDESRLTMTPSQFKFTIQRVSSVGGEELSLEHTPVLPQIHQRALNAMLEDDNVSVLELLWNTIKIRRLMDTEIHAMLNSPLINAKKVRRIRLEHFKWKVKDLVHISEYRGPRWDSTDLELTNNIIDDTGADRRNGDVNCYLAATRTQKLRSTIKSVFRWSLCTIPEQKERILVESLFNRSQKMVARFRGWTNVYLVISFLDDTERPFCMDCAIRLPSEHGAPWAIHKLIECSQSRFIEIATPFNWIRGELQQMIASFQWQLPLVIMKSKSKSKATLEYSVITELAVSELQKSRDCGVDSFDGLLVLDESMDLISQTSRYLIVTSSKRFKRPHVLATTELTFQSNQSDFETYKNSLPFALRLAKMYYLFDVEGLNQFPNLSANLLWRKLRSLRRFLKLRRGSGGQRGKSGFKINSISGQVARFSYGPRLFYRGANIRNLSGEEKLVFPTIDLNNMNPHDAFAEAIAPDCCDGKCEGDIVLSWIRLEENLRVSLPMLLALGDLPRRTCWHGHYDSHSVARQFVVKLHTSRDYTVRWGGGSCWLQLKLNSTVDHVSVVQGDDCIDDDTKFKSAFVGDRSTNGTQLIQMFLASLRHIEWKQSDLSSALSSSDIKTRGEIEPRWWTIVERCSVLKSGSKSTPKVLTPYSNLMELMKNYQTDECQQICDEKAGQKPMLGVSITMYPASAERIPPLPSLSWITSKPKIDPEEWLVTLTLPQLIKGFMPYDGDQRYTSCYFNRLISSISTTNGIINLMTNYYATKDMVVIREALSDQVFLAVRSGLYFSIQFDWTLVCHTISFLPSMNADIQWTREEIICLQNTFNDLYTTYPFNPSIATNLVNLLVLTPTPLLRDLVNLTRTDRTVGNPWRLKWCPVVPSMPSNKHRISPVMACGHRYYFLLNLTNFHMNAGVESNIVPSYILPLCYDSSTGFIQLFNIRTPFHENYQKSLRFLSKTIKDLSQKYLSQTMHMESYLYPVMRDLLFKLPVDPMFDGGFLRRIQQQQQQHQMHLQQRHQHLSMQQMRQQHQQIHQQQQMIQQQQHQLAFSSNDSQQVVQQQQQPQFMQQTQQSQQMYAQQLQLGTGNRAAQMFQPSPQQSPVTTTPTPTTMMMMLRPQTIPRHMDPQRTTLVSMNLMNPNASMFLNPEFGGSQQQPPT